jgi:hypothetical protein
LLLESRRALHRDRDSLKRAAAIVLGVGVAAGGYLWGMLHRS